MIRLDDVRVFVPHFTPFEARMAVDASWASEDPVSSARLRIEGWVIGPKCEYAITLSSKVLLKPIPVIEGSRVRAAAQILEPCFWEPEHPFCYEVHLELHDDDRLLDMRRITCGIRHLAVEDQELLLNGQTCFVQGVLHTSTPTIAELEEWHAVDCKAFLTAGATTDLCDRTDRWGPMVFHLLPPMEADVRDQLVRLRNRPSLLLWVIPTNTKGSYLDSLIQTIHDHDPSRPIAQMVADDQPIQLGDGVDLLILSAGHPEIGSPQCSKPYMVIARGAGHRSNPENLAAEIDRLRDQVGLPPQLVGLIV